MLFRDRWDAGGQLADALRNYRGAPDTVVLAIPRGGIIVGAALAQRLALPLAIGPVRKLGAPGNPELAIGAIDDALGIVLDESLIRRLGVTESELEAEVAHQRAELQRWLARMGHSGRRLEPGQQAIVTDDGIATGSTARAAIRAARAQGARRVILAVPVAPHESLEALRPQVDEVVCLATPQPFFAVGNFYESWPQVSDQEVLDLLTATGPRERS